MNTQTPNTRKKRAGTISLILIALLLLSGTYAWQYNQHKTTEAKASSNAVLESIQLVDDSDDTDGWQPGMELTKVLSVRNDGDDGSGITPRFEDAYVRIELKEYMECKNVGQEVYPNRLMIDENGKFIALEDATVGADGSENLGTTIDVSSGTYDGHKAVKLTNALDATGPTDEKWFVETAKGDDNGQYGNFMTTKVTNDQLYITGGAWTAGSAKATVPSADTTTYPGDYHKDGKTEECDYTAIDWTGAAAGYENSANYSNPNTQLFREYVEINFSNNVEFLSDYTAGGSKAGTLAQGAYWLIDDVTQKKYAYWMQPLEPGAGAAKPNATTAEFTTKMKLLKSPNGQYDDGSGQMVDYPLNFYYALHADLDPTLKADYAQDWSGMDAEIQDVLFPQSAPDYFKITFFDKSNPSALTGGTVKVSRNALHSLSAQPVVEYSTDGGNVWNPFYGPAMNGDITVTTGEVLFRGKGGGGFASGWMITANPGSAVKLSGNLNMTLDYENPPDTIEEAAFMVMFLGQQDIVDASELKLPASTLEEIAYYGMFDGCSSLEAAPKLPATTLAKNCYATMFRDCSSLQTAPDLPATTLADGCYINMFSGCTMLNSVSVSFTDWDSALDVTTDWLKDVSDSGTFNRPAGLDPNMKDESHIPQNWTVNPPAP
jgi:hypothetical protein